MKTLDEVIKALVFCSEGLCDDCPFHNEDRHLCQDAKCAMALHYLEEYKKIGLLLPSLVYNTYKSTPKSMTKG